METTDSFFINLTMANEKVMENKLAKARFTITTGKFVMDIPKISLPQTNTTALMPNWTKKNAIISDASIVPPQLGVEMARAKTLAFLYSFNSLTMDTEP